MKVNVSGIVRTVGEPHQLQNGFSQKVVIEKPIFDRFDGHKKNVNYYPITIFDDRIEQMNFKNLIGCKVMAKCYLNSSKKDNNGEEWFMLYLSCIEVKLIEN